MAATLQERLGSLQQHKDNAYMIAGAILEKLTALEEMVQRSLIRDELLYVKDNANTGAGITAAITKTPPPGVDWMIERFAVVSGAGGAVAIYLDEKQAYNLVDFQAKADINAWSPGKEVHVPSGRPIIINFTAQPNNQLCSVNFRAKELAKETGVSSDA